MLVAPLVASLALASCGRDAGAAAGGSSGEPSHGVLSADADSELVFGAVRPFELVDQDGEKVQLADLLGSTWVLANVFTTCTGTCPSVTVGMDELVDRLADTDVRFVTLTVDPEIDTPERLREYAELYGADTHRWSFLTGEEDAIRELAVGDLYFSMSRAPEGEASSGEKISHDTRLVVIDERGQVRGYYDGRTDVGLDRAEARARWLLGQR